jgi:tetratricopeptide (TPR) repeat protein
MKKIPSAYLFALSLSAAGLVAVGTAPIATAQTSVKPKKLTKEDVVKMVQAGIPDSVIISKIQNSGSVFHLEVADMIAMKKQKVSDKVLEAMVNTEMAAGRPPVTPTPAPVVAQPSGTPSEEEEILGVTPPSGGNPEDSANWGGQVGTLGQAAQLYRDQKWPEASDMLFGLIDNHKLGANDLPVAEQRLGDCLYNMGLYQSALYYYEDAVHDGPTSAAFAPSLARMIELSDKLRDDRRLLAELQDIQPAQIPAELRRDAGYFYGQLYFRKDDFDNAKRALHAVGKDSPYYGKARYTEGVILSIEGNNDGAIAAFKDSIMAGGARAPASKVSAGDSPDMIEEEARLAVARTLYAAEKYKEAVEAFRQVSTDGDLWAPSLFDNAWSLYKNGEFGSALGNILSTRSPFFDSYYEPESKILEAIIYYRLCLYPQANATVNNFFAVYAPYSAKIKSFRRQAEKRPPEQVFSFLKDFVDSPRGKAATFMPNDLMLTVAQDGKISDILFHLRAIEYEQSRIRDIGPWRGSRVAAAVIDQMNGHKDSLQKLGGKLVMREMEDQDDKLDNLFAQAKTIRFEITLGEKEALEKSLTGQGGESQLAGKGNEAKIIVPDDHYYWPFEGEYWKDEIGYYQFSVQGCTK